MANRERRRSESQKRKARAAERRSAIASRYEERNVEERQKLEPLEEAERPTVVTIAAVISAVVAVASIVGYALWDVLRDDPRPPALSVVSFVIVIGAMAIGLWRARYWAVLGFQATLVLVMLATTLGTIGALTVGLAIGNFLLLAAAGALFYFMIKAMARIQMPERAPRK